MAGWIILITLAAFGVLSAMWAFFGCLLPAQRGGAAVCLCRGKGQEEPLIRRYLWLWELGLVRCPLVLVDCGLSESERARWRKVKHIILCTQEELSSILEQERNRLG